MRILSAINAPDAIVKMLDWGSLNSGDPVILPVDLPLVSGLDLPKDTYRLMKYSEEKLKAVRVT